eukprot:CAMPEP_0119040700 /NCGR_PEP_ID=MMETSP1177-20130426/10713_1 /TAXON_ID=2985 /ORGANISM="Ochromonas sp, Strain CCMP1899" /LENGTH=182 /DNA_ID=CAMNT_0007006011 /DNA_START=129 /DNA_END=677 /DNA_ORIENTATION=-
MAVAQAGGLNITHTVSPDMEGLKPELPFGQLPYLVDGDVKLAQSMAILHYLSKKGGLQGDTDASYAVSEMFIEEANDIFSMVNKANTSPDKTVGYANLYADDGPLQKQLGFLEKMHNGDGPYFNNQEKQFAGAYTLGAVFDILVHLEPSALDSFPKMKLFYTTIIATSAFDGIKDFGMYFKR